MRTAACSIPNSGLLSLAATARHGLAAEQLWDHAQPLVGGLDVLVGLGGAEQAAGLSRGVADARPGVRHARPVAATAPPTSSPTAAGSAPTRPTLELFPHAALVLLVARTAPEHLARVRDRAGALSAKLHGSQRGAAALGYPPIGVLLIAEAGQDARLTAQVNEMLVASQISARVVGTLAHDPAGAEMLNGRRRGRLDKSLLIRSARQITADVPQRYGVLR